jgi:predicted nucleic acid-binding protein
MLRVYFDICALQRPLDEQVQVRIRLEAEAVKALIQLCEAGVVEMVSSAAHQIENDKNPHPDRKAHATNVLSLAAHRASNSSAVRTRTAEYVASGLGKLDAFHLALAVESEARYFCTTDDKLIRRAKRLDTQGTHVVSPPQLVMLLDLP